MKAEDKTAQEGGTARYTRATTPVPSSSALLPPARRNGFTLLEVLVALAVIAIGLAATIRVGATSAANAIHLRDKTFAQYVAAIKAVELQLQPQWPALGTQRGHTPMGLREWSWATRVSETFDERMRRVDIEVGIDDKTTVAVLTAYLPQPTQQ